MYAPLIISVIILVSLIVTVICTETYNNKRSTNEHSKTKNKHNKYSVFVEAHSVAIKKLKYLNANYQFYRVYPIVYTHDYDNEKLYNEVSCYDYMIYQLQFFETRQEVFKQINNDSYNQTLYDEYSNRTTIIKLGKFDVDCKNMKMEKLLKEEKLVFNSYRIPRPISFKISVNLMYRNMAGILINEKHFSYGTYEICHAIDLLKDRNGTFYNNRSIWDSICRVERARVSNKMRFSIYQRDNYRCKICGRIFEADYLEIDHIYPISKGGKSVYDNLQTLCKTCNKNKGNKII